MVLIYWGLHLPRRSDTASTHDTIQGSEEASRWLVGFAKKFADIHAKNEEETDERKRLDETRECEDSSQQFRARQK